MSEVPAYIDAAGCAHQPAGSSARIVSLVPSITELLFELGLGAQVVGRTGFCIHPRTPVRNVPKVGGTKDVRLDVLRALRPTHVIVNVDENEYSTVEEIRSDVTQIIVTHPNAPDDNVALFHLLGSIFNARERAEQLASELRCELDACSEIIWPCERVLYLIWKKPWMTVAADTYIARTLACVGWQVPTAPGGWAGAARYPEVPDIEAAAQDVDRVLLSSEPFMFRERDIAELEEQLDKPVQLVDGEMTSWYGNRAIVGLGYLRRIRGALTLPAGR
ncbi:MAG: helical backbone metal receptor [Pseudomonadota bacterium]|nr:helical backbone metal receptor [Pseudomonadota bacterium]